MEDNGNYFTSTGMIVLITFFLSTSVLSILTENRLPTNVIPTHYKVDIEVDTETRKISGKVCIEIKCEINSYEIRLHAKKKYGRLMLDDDMKIRYLKTNSQQIHINSKTYNEVSDILTLETTYLQAGKEYVLCISFKGDITEENNYIIWKSTEQSEDKYIIATNFKRQSAFPCFDEPTLRATFVLQLSMKSFENSYSNGYSKRELKTNKEGWVQETYDIKKRLPPSQIAFVVTNINLYYYINWFTVDWIAMFNFRPEVKNKLNLEFKLLESGVKPKYDSLGPSFTFPKVTFIIVPTDKPIYTKYWTLVLIRESDLTVGSDDDVIYSIYVRMARQWFGAIVSPDSWDSVWMFNALATYVAYLQMEKQPFLENIPSLMWQSQRDNLEENIIKGFEPFMDDKVRAWKGLMLLRMVQTALGKYQTVQAIDDFLKAYRNKSAGLQQLWEVFDGRSKGALPKHTTWSHVMKQWTEQEGYPVVNVKNIGNGKFKLSQEPFGNKKLKSNTQPATSDTSCWWIPLTFTSANKADFQAKRTSPDKLIGCDSNKEISVKTKARKGDWVIFNLNYPGLYRVKYDDDMWKLIVTALKTNPEVFSPSIRAQLVNDALALAWQGHVKYEYAFKLLPFLRGETDDSVLKVFFIEATNLKDILQASAETNRMFQDYITHILNREFYNNYISYGLFDSPGKLKVQKVDSLFYSWSCITLRITSCITRALTIFDEWRTKDSVSANVQGSRRSIVTTIFCTVLKEQQENNDIWFERSQFFLKTLKYDDNNLNLRPVLLEAIKCSSDMKTIDSLLEWATSSTPDKTTLAEKQKGFLELARGFVSSGPTRDYFYKNIDKIQAYYESEDVLAEIVKILTSKMTLDQLDKMKTFVASRLDFEKIKSSLNEGEAIAKWKIEWLNENDIKIREALDASLRDQL